MIVYKDFTTFDVLGEKINIFSTENEYGLNTVIEFGNGHYFHLGDEPVNIESAVSGWQKFYQMELSKDEITYILNDNSIIYTHNNLGELNGNEERNQEACEEGSKETSSKETSCEEASQEDCKKASS
jgi:hypothetical protein